MTIEMYRNHVTHRGQSWVSGIKERERESRTKGDVTLQQLQYYAPDYHTQTDSLNKYKLSFVLVGNDLTVTVSMVLYS